VIVAECVFIQIILKVLFRDCMINATDTTLQKTPEPVDGIGVNVAFHVNPRAVIDDMMFVPVAPDSSIARHVVGVNDGFLRDIFSEHRHQRFGFDVDNFSGNYSSFSFNDSSDGSFSFSSASALSTPSTAYVSFIHFYVAAEHGVIFPQKRSNLMKHSPRSFVGHSKFTFKLLGGDSATNEEGQVLAIGKCGVKGGSIC
jgi:hypothetical protein